MTILIFAALRNMTNVIDCSVQRSFFMHRLDYIHGNDSAELSETQQYRYGKLKFSQQKPTTQQVAFGFGVALIGKAQLAGLEKVI